MDEFPRCESSFVETIEYVVAIMNDSTNSSAPAFPRNASRSRSLLRTLISLVVFTVVLLVFIAWLGDWRRRHNIETLMSSQVQSYSSITTEAGVLPLNLKPSLPLDPPSRIIDTWLNPEEARMLRGADHEVMVAWTIPLVKALGRNERAVIFFDHGAYSVRWLPPREFDALFAKQIGELKRLGP